VRDTLKVCIADTPRGTGSSREIEPATSGDHLVEMLLKGTRTKPDEAGARGFADELNRTPARNT
jgi:hypothetical protein